MIEVTEIHPENDLFVSENGVTTRLVKTGLYDLDLKKDELWVFDGKAVVDDDNKNVRDKGGHELRLADNSSLKQKKFDKKAYIGK